MTEELSLGHFKKIIPKHCFEKSASRSLFYMFRDLLLLSTAFITFDFFSQSWIGLFVYWNIYGFLLWCLFVIGHDCGHGSFSHSYILNSICGHICHGVILVPFWPWAYSHKKHHQYHNKIEEDRSHPWFTKEEWNGFSRWQRAFTLAPFLPFIAYFLYLFAGYTDGSHVNPNSLLYKKAPRQEKIKCVVSTIVILLFLGLLLLYSGTFTTFLLFYGGCWIVFSFWLFVVTYMQHHKEETCLFNEDNWNYVDGALETVDRRYGFGIDDFHHNITDCHLVHHLFFQQIPHYHLKEATESLKKFLAEKDIPYHFIDQTFFPWDFFKVFYNTHFTNWKLKVGERRGAERNNLNT